jgi:hypothetical protein
MRQTDILIIEKPVKFAILAALIFAVSAFLLGYAYKFQAFNAIGMSSINGSWDEIQDISGFSIDRSLRYFMFYFMTFLSLACFTRSPVRSSPWALLILFAVIPTVMSLIPFVFTENFQASGFWGMEAMMIALIYSGVGARYPSMPIRFFFFLLIVFLLIFPIVSDALMWIVEIDKGARKVYGERFSESKSLSYLFYFAPLAFVKILVNIYLIYRLPRNFIRELGDQLEKEKS